MAPKSLVDLLSWGDISPESSTEQSTQEYPVVSPETTYVEKAIAKPVVSPQATKADPFSDLDFSIPEEQDYVMSSRGASPNQDRPITKEVSYNLEKGLQQGVLDRKDDGLEGLLSTDILATEMKEKPTLSVRRGGLKVEQSLKEAEDIYIQLTGRTFDDDVDSVRSGKLSQDVLTKRASLAREIAVKRNTTREYVEVAGDVLNTITRVAATLGVGAESYVAGKKEEVLSALGSDAGPAVDKSGVPYPNRKLLEVAADTSEKVIKALNPLGTDSKIMATSGVDLYSTLDDILFTNKDDIGKHRDTPLWATAYGLAFDVLVDPFLGSGKSAASFGARMQRVRGVEPILAKYLVEARRVAANGKPVIEATAPVAKSMREAADIAYEAGKRIDSMDISAAKKAALKKRALLKAEQEVQATAPPGVVLDPLAEAKAHVDSDMEVLRASHKTYLKGTVDPDTGKRLPRITPEELVRARADSFADWMAKSGNPGLISLGLRAKDELYSYAQSVGEDTWKFVGRELSPENFGAFRQKMTIDHAKAIGMASQQEAAEIASATARLQRLEAISENIPMLQGERFLEYVTRNADRVIDRRTGFLDSLMSQVDKYFGGGDDFVSDIMTIASAKRSNIGPPEYRDVLRLVDAAREGGTHNLKEHFDLINEILSNPKVTTKGQEAAFDLLNLPHTIAHERVLDGTLVDLDSLVGSAKGNEIEQILLEHMDPALVSSLRSGTSADKIKVLDSFLNKWGINDTNKIARARILDDQFLATLELYQRELAKGALAPKLEASLRSTIRKDIAIGEEGSDINNLYKALRLAYAKGLIMSKSPEDAIDFIRSGRVDEYIEALHPDYASYRMLGRKLESTEQILSDVSKITSKAEEVTASKLSEDLMAAARLAEEHKVAEVRAYQALAERRILPVKADVSKESDSLVYAYTEAQRMRKESEKRLLALMQKTQTNRKEVQSVLMSEGSLRAASAKETAIQELQLKHFQDTAVLRKKINALNIELSQRRNLLEKYKAMEEVPQTTPTIGFGAKSTSKALQVRSANIYKEIERLEETIHRIEKSLEEKTTELADWRTRVESSLERVQAETDLHLDIKPVKPMKALSAIRKEAVRGGILPKEKLKDLERLQQESSSLSKQKESNPYKEWYHLVDEALERSADTISEDWSRIQKEIEKKDSTVRSLRTWASEQIEDMYQESVEMGLKTDSLSMYSATDSTIGSSIKRLVGSVGDAAPEKDIIRIVAEARRSHEAARVIYGTKKLITSRYARELTETAPKVLAENEIRIAHAGKLYAVDKEVWSAVQNIEESFKPSTFGQTNQFIKLAASLWNSGTSIWKSKATVSRPKYHGNNAVGNAFNMILGGFQPWNPDSQVNLWRAIDVGIIGALKTKGIQYEAARATGTEAELVRKSKSFLIGQAERTAKKVWVDPHGREWTGMQLYDMAEKIGIIGKGWASAIADDEMAKKLLKDPSRTLFRKAVKAFSGINPLGGNHYGIRLGGLVGKGMDDHARLTMFLDQILRVGADPFVAKEKTLRALPDFTRLSKTEKAIKGFGIPFYSWLRYNLPFQLESVLKRPGLFFIPDKIKRSLDKKYLQDLNEEDQVLSGEIVPSWMQKSYLYNLGSSLVGMNKISNEDNLFIASVNLPSSDLKTFGGLIGEEGSFSGMIHPIIKSTIELGLGRTLTGRAITKEKGAPPSKLLGMKEIDPVLTYLYRSALPDISSYHGLVTAAGELISGDTPAIREQAKLDLWNNISPIRLDQMSPTKLAEEYVRSKMEPLVQETKFAKKVADLEKSKIDMRIVPEGNPIDKPKLIKRPLSVPVQTSGPGRDQYNKMAPSQKMSD